MPNFQLETALGGRVAGIDEAGRGPWAGPVVASCVVLDPVALPPSLMTQINDSKKLTRAKREAIFTQLGDAAMTGTAWIGIAEGSVLEIESLNILRATLLAMRRAFDKISPPADAVLVDGRQSPGLPCPVRCVIGGDSTSLAIAAASIVAKVTRDHIMADLALSHPEYGWERNSGYGTKEHIEALVRYGVTPHHRRGFKPIRKILTLDTAGTPISR